MTAGLFENLDLAKSEAQMLALGQAEINGASQADQLWANLLLIVAMIDSREDIPREEALRQWDVAMRWAFEELDCRKALYSNLTAH